MCPATSLCRNSPKPLVRGGIVDHTQHLRLTYVTRLNGGYKPHSDYSHEQSPGYMYIFYLFLLYMGLPYTGYAIYFLSLVWIPVCTHETGILHLISNTSTLHVLHARLHT